MSDIERSDDGSFNSGDEDDPHQYELDYEPPEADQYGDLESGEEDHEEDEDPVEAEDDEASRRPKVDKNNLKLCPTHSYGEMTKTCVTCSAALSIITDKKLLKELTSSSSSKEHDLLSRYGDRVDEVKPTLSLDSSTIKVAQKIFSQGVFQDSKLWKEIVRAHLTLPPHQHEELTSNLKSESLLKKFKRDRRFRHIFNYQKEMIDVLSNLRIAQRPIFALIERTAEDLDKVRSIGEDVDLTYNDVTPDKVSEVNVPKRQVPDKLKYEKFDKILPRPDIHAFVQANNLNMDTANAVIKLLEDYRTSVGKKFMDLYDVCSANLNATEDYLIFYTNLIAHVDSSYRDLARNKAASLFRGDIKAEVLDQTSSRKMKDTKSEGLLGGQFVPIFIYLYFHKYIFR